MAGADIETTIGEYIRSATFGDDALLETVLHSDFRTVGYFEGKPIWIDRAGAMEVCRKAAEEPRADFPEWSIRNTEVLGETAVVIVDSHWTSSVFSEIVTLLRENGRWRIVFKAFHVT